MQKRSRESQPLSLAAGQVAAVLGDLGGKALPGLPSLSFPYSALSVRIHLVRSLPRQIHSVRGLSRQARPVRSFPSEKEPVKIHHLKRAVHLLLIRLRISHREIFGDSPLEKVAVVRHQRDILHEIFLIDLGDFKSSDFNTAAIAAIPAHEDRGDGGFAAA